MPNETDEIVIAANGSLHVAPVGTSLPGSISDTLNGAFVELGFATEDGATLTDSKTIQVFRAWQTRYAVRRVVTERDTMIAFALEQWNEENFALAFGGGEFTEPNPGEFRYTPPPAEELDERALVLRAQDGDKNYQWIFPRGMVTEGVEVPLKATDMAILPITFSVVAQDGGDPWIFDTDDPAFATGS